MSKLTITQRLTLNRIERFGGRHLDGMSAAERRRATDLGMMEPPLVEVDGSRVAITAAGLQELTDNPPVHRPK